jgi:Tfp pilus assembly protein PilV
MMLLAAVILVIGFVALAGMVSRVSQLASQASREQDHLLLREVEPMLGAVNAAIDPTAAPTGKGIGAYAPPVAYPSAAYDNAVAGILRHLRQVEAAQGIFLDWRLVCVAGTPNTGYAAITLNDGSLQVTVRSNPFNRPAPCTPLAG